jgi:hypothetical protein
MAPLPESWRFTGAANNGGVIEGEIFAPQPAKNKQAAIPVNSDFIFMSILREVKVRSTIYKRSSL